MSFTSAVRSLQRYQPQVLRWLAGLAVCAGICALYLSGSLLFIDRQLTAARFQLVTSEPTGDVVVVEIDADSLQKIAVWPWPRKVHAEVIDKVREAGARQIAVDVDFSAESSKDQDLILAEALARADGNVILLVFEQVDSKKGIISSKPLPMFAEHTRIASANIYPDSDGIVRRLARVDVWRGNPVPTMAAAAAGLEPTATGRYYVDFGIASDQIKKVSYVDVLDEAKFDPSVFAGKIVMLGATADELGDTVATPVGVMPGVMVQALAAESLLQDRDLHKVSRWLILAIACILFFLIEGICRNRGWRHGIAAGAGALIAILGLPLVVQANLPLMVETAPWLTAVSAAFLMALFERLRDLDLRLIGQAILLRRTDALMRQVVENSSDGLLVIDDQGKVRSVNPAAERILGQHASEIVGQHFFDVIATPSHQPPIHSLSRMAYADRPSQMELTRPDGSTLIADVGLSRLPEQQPNAAFVAQLHDVTEMKMREAELRAARDQAEAASNSKSQFLANMSHELRTPLNAVIGFSEIMKTELLGPIGTETYRGYSHSIHDSAKHLLGIINDILDISSIESGSPRLHEGIHEPEQICQSVIALVAGRAEQAQVKLVVNVEPVTDLLYADGRMLKQMLINLVGNAIKFSPKGGSIEIKVSPAGPEPHGGVVFAVADEGIGIAKDDIPRILKPFEQVETAFARNFDGIGLGLPLVNSMARLHGATLTIDSELNVGTTVSILFPAARTRPRTAEAGGTAQIVEITPVRIRAAE